MKIGVFGDSFAEKKCVDIWWRYLENQFGHTVTCYGESGSSLLFSSTLISQHAQEFDKIIWCTTSVNRISFQHNEQYYHSTGTELKLGSDAELSRKFAICHDFITEVFDWNSFEIGGHALIQFFLEKYPHLSVLPSFATPMYYMKEHGFNLYDLCQQETDYYFPGKSVSDVYLKYQDNRPGHLTSSTQEKLAQLINNNLHDKIYDFEYKEFDAPTEPFETVFSLRK